MPRSHVLKRKHCACPSFSPPPNPWLVVTAILVTAVVTATSNLAEEGGPLERQSIKAPGTLTAPWSRAASTAGG